MLTTTQPELDAALAALAASKTRWTQTTPAQRLDLLSAIQRDLLAVMPEWVAASLHARQGEANPYVQGDEWAVASIIFRLLHELRQTLHSIDRDGQPRLPVPLYTRPDGWRVARVFPNSLTDRAFYTGIQAETWLEPDTPVFQPSTHSGKIALVLGAGNIASLPPADVLNRLFNENQVVILKMNPINAYLGPLIERGFRVLVEGGFLRVVYGGADVAQYLAQHPLVDTLHLTGSDKTYEAIVFGGGAAGAQRKAQRQPLVTKPFSAELGNITPIIIVPGPWTARDIAYQARSLAFMLIVNAGFTCLAARVLVQHAGWNQRETLNRALGQVFSSIPTQYAYYPGAHERHAAFLAQHPHALQYGQPADGHLPWTYIPGLSPDVPDDICYQTEAFCSLVAETALPAASVEDYLEKAVDFANERLWGTLTTALIVHPRSLREPRIAAAVERALARLRYGTVHLNVYPFAGIFMATLPWGGIAGQDCYDIQSGTGFVNNTYMLARPHKSIIRGPFKLLFRPASTMNRRYPHFFRPLMHYEADRSLGWLPSIAQNVIRGQL